ncbi:hypothetical protein Asp14428_43160 [Actinoplanes sp. NBRC 14428]|nr:hypothetical protein Asp14428_43160 [Actinoplanes sp. NBRC 14428]
MNNPAADPPKPTRLGEPVTPTRLGDPVTPTRRHARAADRTKRNRLGDPVKDSREHARAADPEERAGRRARFAADRGAASFFVLAVGLAVVSGGVAGAAVGAARVGRHEARTAADLGALAGAMRAIEGERSACARAAELVAANGARLLSCRLEGMEIVVEVATPVTPLPGLTLRATAAARAGPARG